VTKVKDGILTKHASTNNPESYTTPSTSHSPECGVQLSLVSHRLRFEGWRNGVHHHVVRWIELVVIDKVLLEDDPRKREALVRAAIGLQVL
jgi:hypothetical protein